MASRNEKTTRSKGKKPADQEAKAPKTPKATSKTTKERQIDTRARIIMAIVFLLLAVFSCIGWFAPERGGTIPDLFRMLERGLVGSGWWCCGLVFLWAAIQLFFHKNKPVRLRVTAIVSIPVLLGTMIHAVMIPAEQSYQFSAADFMRLFNQGGWNSCGGILGGYLAQVLVAGCSRVGAVLVLLLIAGVLVMYLTRTPPMKLVEKAEDAIDQWREQGELRPKKQKGILGGYDAEENAANAGGDAEPMDSGDLGETTFAQSVVEQFSRRSKRKKWDIPLDGEDPSLTGQQQEIFAQPEPELDLEPDPTEVFIKKGKQLFQRKKQQISEPPEEQRKEIRQDPPDPLMKKERFVADTQIQHELVEAVSVEVDEYQAPPVELLHQAAGVSGLEAGWEMNDTKKKLTETIASFGIQGRIVDSTRGPSVTRYEFELERGVKLSKLTNLSQDIALSLGAFSVRIAPVVGKNSVVGIEVPNRLVSPVPIRAVLDSEEFRDSKSSVSFAVGKDISNHNVIGDIAKMPHLLIAGTTGSGKSVCTNSMIISLLYKSSPKEVRLIMVDPKMVELSNYNGIPHLLIPVVTDPKKAAGALQWAVFEMLQRYQDFADLGVRDLEGYNAVMKADPERGEPKPKIVVFIDELADLMIAAAKEVEESICRVAQMGRAAGIHLVIATQRPSSDVITGLMKANIPSRIALAVASAVDSRIILDSSGAENLVGNGDMLYSPLGKPKRRVQGCYISDEEVNSVIDEIKRSCGTAEYRADVMQQVEENARKNEKGNKGGPSAFNVSTPDNYGSTDPEDDRDPLFYDAVDVVVELQMASASTLQRKLKVGYARAARLVDQMEEYGYVGPFEGSKPRSVTLSKEEWAQKKVLLGAGAGLDPNLELAKMMSEAPSEDEEEPPFDGEKMY